MPQSLPVERHHNDATEQPVERERRSTSNLNQHFMAAATLTETLCGGDAAMPEISRFLGIVIRMYYRDHAPPHFHAEYAEYEITVEIGTGVVEGRFPRRALSAVLEWYNLHEDELSQNWELARQEQPLNRIAPLE